MKRIHARILTIAILVYFTSFALPQTSHPAHPAPAAAPTPTVADLQRKLDIAEVAQAVSDAELAAAAADASAKSAQALSQHAGELITLTKKKLGYPEDWDWNFQTKQFAPNPQHTNPGAQLTPVPTPAPSIK